MNESTNCDVFTLDACVVKSGRLSDVFEQLFPNLPQLSAQEQPDVLRALVDKFSPKTERSETARADQQPGPRSNHWYDGRDSLIHPGHEATAQWMSTPKSEQEFKTVTEFAQSLEVTRKTIHLWMNAPVVLRRALYLTRPRKLQCEIIARRESPSIMQAMSDQANAGDVASAKLVLEQHRSEQKQTRGPDPDMSLREMFQRTLEENPEVLPSPEIEDVE